jgi:hypothetical protein
MRGFILNVLLFVCPIMVLVAIPIALLILSKENFFDIQKVIEGKKKYLIGYVYNEHNYKYLKWEYLNSHDKNDVIVLGSSRVLQFRKQMFDATFYNAGYTVSSLNDFKPFLQGLPIEKHPNYLIIGLDQWMFNEEWDSLVSRPKVESWENSFSKFPENTVYKDVFKNFLSGKYKFQLFTDTDSLNRIGLNARMNNVGFRNDGSFCYGVQIDKLLANDSTANDFGFADTFDRIKKGNRRFEFGDFVNSEAIEVLDDFLKYCKNKNIYVIAFLPPFPNKVFDKMEDCSKYGYVNEISPRIQILFEKYDYEFYDFSTVSKCNSNDNETIDGLHGGELVYQRMLMEILRANSVLNSVSDSVRIKLDLEMSINRFTVYAY